MNQFRNWRRLIYTLDKPHIWFNKYSRLWVVNPGSISACAKKYQNRLIERNDEARAHAIKLNGGVSEDD